MSGTKGDVPLTVRESGGKFAPNVNPNTAGIELPGRGRGPGRKFVKGQSGNPGGTPAWVKEIRALAAQGAPRAIERLKELVENANPGVALAASVALLDRAGIRPFIADEAVALLAERVHDATEEMSQQESGAKPESTP